MVNLLGVLFADNTWYLLNVFVQSIGYYFQYLIQVGDGAAPRARPPPLAVCCLLRLRISESAHDCSIASNVCPYSMRVVSAL